MQFGEMVGTGDDMVDLRHVDHAFAVGEGHQLVGLDDDALCHTDGGQRIVARNAQRAVALFVGRCGLEYRHVAGYLVANHFWHILEVGGEEVALEVVDRVARVSRQEVAYMAEMTIAAGM